MKPRQQYGSAAFIDNFLYDEPSANFLKIEKALPFKMFLAGAQPGCIGLHRKDENYHRNYINSKSLSNDMIITGYQPTNLFTHSCCWMKTGRILTV
jgi:hypothetical protein